MPNAFKKLFNNTNALLTQGANTTYTVPSAPVTSHIISNLTIVNTSTTASSTIAIYQSGSAVQNMIQPPITLQPGEKAVWRNKQLAAADFLVFAAGAAASNVLSILIEGDEVTA